MKSLTRILLPALSAVLMFNATVMAATVTVSGEARLQVPADLALLSVTVETHDKEAEDALKANNRAMDRVRQALTRQGAEDSELSTGSFSIRPQWTPRPRDPAPDWRPEITGYVVSNQLSIETTRLVRVGPWIQAATEAGATGVGQLRFGLGDPAEARSRAIAEAVTRARQHGEAAAAAAGVSLAGLQSLRVDGADARPMQPRLEMAVRTMGVADSPSITPGEVEVEARVELVYETEAGSP